MDLRIFVEPQQGATYLQQLAMARTAEDEGFDAFFRSDHFTRFGDGDPLPGPTDSWVTLGALARETTSIRLGTLVTSATFRLPGPLAIAVAQVDEMSDGRVECGLGTGWFDEEHRNYGIPFPPLGERFAMLEEQLQILRGLWTTPVGETFDFTGEHYQVQDSPALPKPTLPGGPPIIVGGLGEVRTPRLAAAYATEHNQPFVSVDFFAQRRAAARAACEDIGRDPDDLITSVAQVVCCAENDVELARRAGRIGQGVEHLREHALCGSPAEVLDKLATYAEAGATRVYLQVLDMDDLDHIRLLGDQVLRVLP
jgi:F420-dependent oxidoreductase-like protein